MAPLPTLLGHFVRIIPLAGIILSLAGLGRSVRAQDPGSDSLARREATVFRALQHAVAANDREAVAATFVYPFRVNRSPKSFFTVRSRAQLIKSFADVLPDTIRRAILRQNPDSLFHNWQGTMVGNGEVWISGVCEDRAAVRCRYGVTAVNLPGPHP